MKSIDDIIQHLKFSIVEITLGNIDFISINNDSSLIKDLGIDSLDYAQVMLAGEEYINNKINENSINWGEINTIKQLAEILYRSQSG